MNIDFNLVTLWDNLKHQNLLIEIVHQTAKYYILDILKVELIFISIHKENGLW